MLGPITPELLLLVGALLVLSAVVVDGLMYLTRDYRIDGIPVKLPPSKLVNGRLPRRNDTI